MSKNKEIDYSLVDPENGNRYCIKINERDKAKFDYDEKATYRKIQALKRAGVRPLNKPEEPVDDLRSPHQKKAKPGRNPVFQPNAESTMVENDFGDGPSRVVKSLNASFEASMILNDEAEVEDVVVLAKDKPIICSSWYDEDAGHTFLNVMGSSYFDEFKKKKTPKSVFTNISRDMKALGYHFTPDELYAKRRGLQITYCGLKKREKKHQDQWAYFEAMSYLSRNEWPEGFRSQSLRNKINGPSTDDGQENGADDSLASALTEDTSAEDTSEFPPVSTFQQDDVSHEDGNGIQQEDDVTDEDNVVYMERTQILQVDEKDWGNIESDKALLEEVTEAKDHFGNQPLLKNSDLFKEVARNLIIRNYNVDWETCQKRYNTILRKFREEDDKLKATGAAKCKWALYDMVYNLEKDKVTTKPAVTVSAGAASSINRAFEVVSKMRTGQSRSPSATRQRRVQNLMGPPAPVASGAVGYKNKALQIAERKLNVEERYLEQFEQYRSESRERSMVFREGVAVLKELKNQLKKPNADNNNN